MIFGIYPTWLKAIELSFKVCYHCTRLSFESQSESRIEIFIYKSYDDLPLFLNAAMVAKVLGVSPSSGFGLMHEPGFPVLRIGNRMVVPKEQFIQWVNERVGGGV